MLFFSSLLFNAKDNVLLSPLIVAIQTGSIDMVDCLLLNGANVDHGWNTTRIHTPFQTAVSRIVANTGCVRKVYEDMALLLVAHGAKVSS